MVKISYFLLVSSTLHSYDRNTHQ